MPTPSTGQPPGEQPLAITISNVAPGTLVCGLRGEIDLATVPGLQETLTQAIDLLPCHLVIDLSDIQYLGSAGLQLLLKIHETQQAAGYHLALVIGPNHAAARPLQATSLHQILDLHTELATAVTACRAHLRPDRSQGAAPAAQAHGE
ncbi:MAG: STAS domain-containing protein [Sciscionella sp.]